MRLGQVVVVVLVAAASSGDSLYDRLALPRSASAREIKKAWYKAALQLHPDKVEGSAEQKAQAELRFKAAAEAYEVLSDVALKRQYDLTGAIPDDKAKTEAATRSSGNVEDPDEQFGFESGGRGGQQRQQYRGFGFGWGRYDAFEVGLAQQRARRVRTLEQMRRILQPHGVAPAAGLQRPRFGLVGFYRRGEEASLKEHLRFPYPFAGWSLGAQGDGFWWEDAVQTLLVSVGELASNEGAALLEHFGVGKGGDVRLPAVAWVRTDAALSFEMAPPLRDADAFVAWVYGFLGASVRIVNRDHRRAVVWWLDGHHAKQQGVVEADGGTFERSSFISHRWYVWPEGTEGNILSQEASLGEITLSRVGEIHDLQLSARCIDSNGHCHQWKHLGECEKNRGYMSTACRRSCGGCDGWDWLYPLGLAQLHEKLDCWADAACRANHRYPAVPPPLASSSSSKLSVDIRGLRQIARHPLTSAWLVDGIDARTRAALDKALRPPPAPLPPSKPPAASPPPLNPRGNAHDEL